MWVSFANNKYYVMVGNTRVCGPFSWEESAWEYIMEMQNESEPAGSSFPEPQG